MILLFTYFCMGNNSTEKNTADENTVESEFKEEKTENIPDEMPILQEPEAVPEIEKPKIETEEKSELTCTITIRCDTILDNMSSLDEAKHQLIPSDGIILSKREVTFNEGENVFDVLLRETRNNKIHMEFVKSPVYDSAYIEGIHNLYEFDCGELSGWMYSVNGWFPNYGCSNYILNDGDNIEWVYTCNLGNDVK